LYPLLFIVAIAVIDVATVIAVSLCHLRNINHKVAKSFNIDTTPGVLFVLLLSGLLPFSVSRLLSFASTSRREAISHCFEPFDQVPRPGKHVKHFSLLFKRAHPVWRVVLPAQRSPRTALSPARLQAE
jgi:hypothetical protein